MDLGQLTRRSVLGTIAGSVAAARLVRAQGHSEDGMTTIVRNARISTLYPSRPEAEAIAIRDGLVLATGTERQVRAAAGERAQVIDAAGRRVIPGLNDSHTHLIRGGLNFNMELRWEGVRR